MSNTIFHIPDAQLRVREFTYLRNATHTRAFLVAGIEQHLPPEQAAVYLIEFGKQGAVKRTYAEIAALIDSGDMEQFTPCPLEISEINKKQVA